MKVGEVCSRLAIDVESDQSVRSAAELMRKYHVGYLVVTEPDHGGRVPIGTLTDRDVVLETVAVGTDPDDVTVSDIMDQDPPLVAAEGDQLSEALEAMRLQGVRRVPVVDAHRNLVGVLALDDILQLLNSELGMIAEIVGSQRRLEAKVRT
jgi:CBS domain-containing protein